MFGRIAARAVAILIVCSPFIIGDPSTALTQYQVNVGSLAPLAPSSQAPAVAEPFGLPVEPVTYGQVLSKWSGLVADISAESDILAQCRYDAPAAHSTAPHRHHQPRHQYGDQADE